MKGYIFYFFLFMSIVCCNSGDNKNELEKQISPMDCKCELEASLEIWHYGGNQNLIGSYSEKFENKYIQSINGWDKNNYPYPKMFDVKVNIQNNLLAYEQENPKKISDYLLNVILKFKVGKSPNSLYPLNSSLRENIAIVQDRIITNSDFKNQETEITILKKDIPFEEYYNKYKERGLFINQLVFEVILIDKEKKNKCSYEHIFLMAESGE